MTYSEFIQQILDTRGRFGIPEGEYKERHHIIPKCIGGTDDKDNLIDLYAQEHYEAHQLLFIENPKNYGIVTSFWQMCNCTSAALNKRNYEITAFDYEQARIKFSQMHSAYMKEKQVELKNLNCGWYSEESRKKSIQRSYEVRKANGFKRSETFSNKISESNKGRHWYNNGKINTYTYSCPPGFTEGRLINYDDTLRIINTRENQNKAVRCKETGVIYESIKLAEALTGASHIGDVCKGKLKTSRKLHWEFVDRSELK